jgi:hypothetical protein
MPRTVKNPMRADTAEIRRILYGFYVRRSIFDEAGRFRVQGKTTRAKAGKIRLSRTASARRSSG